MTDINNRYPGENWDEYDEQYLHKLLRSEGDNYEWQHRLYVQPLTEKTENKGKNGELAVNTTTGHISVYNNEGKISATKNIESELDLQKFWVDNLSKMLDATMNELNNIKQKYLDAENRIKGFYELLHTMENLMKTVETLRQAVENRINHNSLNLFKYHKMILEYIPIFLMQYLQVLDVIRKIDELEYIYGILMDYMSKINTEINNVKAYYPEVERNVNTRIFKRTYLNWVNGITNYWNNELNHVERTGINTNTQSGNVTHYIGNWGKLGKLHISHTTSAESDNPDIPDPIGNPPADTGVMYQNYRDLL